ncbi:dihydropteroate synthase [Clostridium sp. MSTE9]|uniref:dihydropteroate synthase n=1 Tax=Clostridium sp. (strain MSTE9) TaxID=1105031 RepID=UPI00026F2990|nr:dihydropteroate synthase [Clostridium sp. MSTE9]EJF42450.1 dihydropteroate synthase [Clostridium sp. MSTE9]
MSGFQVGKYFLSLNGPACIMGILNVTPDSFSDGGQNFRPEDAVVHALEMQEQGAGMIDIGGQSTRPGFTAIPPQEEWGRIEPVLKALQGRLSVPVSVDTFYPQVASMALSAGADVINDVNGFTDPAMFPAVLQSGCGCIIMHNGHVLEEDPEEDILFRVRRFFEDKLRQAQEIGIARERICFDPGVGFGKTYEENLRLIANVDAVRIEGCAFLMAASRKGVIGKSCGDPPAEDRMSGTLAAHTLAQAGGAQLLRVHDVREAVQAAQVAYAVLSAKAGGTSLG